MKRHIFLVVFSFLLLAAHFLHGGQIVVVVGCCLAPSLLLVKRHWARWVVQMLLYGGAVVWLWTAAVLTHERRAHGGPWIRLLAILGTVSVLTIVAGLSLSAAAVKKHFR